MARYSAFLGRRVEVQYRAGDILLPAIGTFVADSGRSIFLEHHYIQRDQPRQFRWEIPYRYIVRLTEVAETALVAAASAGEKTAGLIARDAPPAGSSSSLPRDSALVPDADGKNPSAPVDPLLRPKTT
jgi:hypothetical protein